MMGLAVGGAFHTPLMEPAQRRLDAAIDATRFADASVPMVANVDAEAHTGAGEFPRLLSGQLCRPV
ncbi:hypothetical protein ACSTLH_00455, partial [Vibrio parahaemolyticus]